MKLPFSLIFCFCFSYITAQNASVEALQKTIGEAVKSEGLTHGAFGVSILEVETNKSIAGHNDERTMIPASTLKLVTTATALQQLGKDFRFETKLMSAGAIETGVLNGDVLIKGGGDPALGSDRFVEYNGFLDQWVEAVKAKGIKKINGNIVADNSFFKGTPTPPGWTWEDMGNYYGSGVFGLNIYDNTYHLVFESGPNAGDATRILRTEPEIPGLIFTNDVTSGERAGDNAYVYGAPFSNNVYVTGTITKGQSAFTRTKGCIPNPPLFTAQLLLKKLTEAGIEVTGSATITNEAPTQEQVNIIHTTYSPTLEKIIAETNAESVNLYAETLLLHAFVKNGQPFNTLTSADMMTAFWKERGINTEGMYLYDGSGLTRKTGITPSQMALIAAKSLKTNPDFYTLFPCVAKEGTVKGMCNNTPAEGNVWMKSGTLDRVRNYAGFAKTKSGKWVSFAIFSNDFSGSSYEIKKIIEHIIVKIAELDE